MKKMILTGIILACGLTAMADDYQYLTVAHADVEQSIELAAIQKITFDTKAGNVVVTTTEGTVNFPITEMEKMFFSATPTAIKAMPLQSNDLKMENGELNVEGNGMLRIYSSNGTLQRMASVKKGDKVSLENLPKGLYIINMGKQSIKVQR